MKKLLFFAFIILAALPVMSKTIIKGVVVDAATQAPLDYVNVALFKINTQTPAAGAISDEKGAFTFPTVTAGKYTLRISIVGYTEHSQLIDVADKPLNIGVIKLKEDSKSLSEVEVIAQGTQMRFEVDKKVFSVDQNIAAAGGSASDVLKNIPSVTVDNEGNVSLRKDGNVEVWINGKASGLTADNRAQVLQQMPAGSIESIEIMTNPSAKYNPEGTAGIINLVMKKNNKAGYYGSVNAGLMIPDSWKIGGSYGASINYNNNKFDAYMNLGYRAMTFQGGGKSDRYNYLTNDTTHLNQTNTMETSFSGVFMRAGINYRLDSKNTIGLSGFGMTGTGDQSSTTNYTLSNATSILRNYTRNTTTEGNRPSFNMNMDYTHNFNKKGSNIIATLAYSAHTRGNDSRYVQTNSLVSTSDLSQNTNGESKDYDFKVDYTNKFNENSKLETGIQSTLSNKISTSDGVDNTTAPASILPTYFNNFDYKEQIHAAYVTYGNRFDKLTAQVGLRAELLMKESSNTFKVGNTIIDTVQTIPSRSFFHLFPSFYLSYNISKTDELQFNYSNRVNRSRGRQINPFKDYSDSTNIKYGNPDLAPQYTSSLELNYIKNWDAQTLSGSLYYKYTDNVIQSVQFINNGILESTYMNIAKSQNTGMEIISKNRISKALNLTSSANLYYIKLDPSVYKNPYNPALITTIPGQEDFSWSVNVLANLMFSKTLSGQITGEYDSPKIIAQGTTNASYSVDLGLRQTLFARKMSVNLFVRDLFNSDRNNTTTSGAGFTQTSESYFHGRMFGVTLSYNFGNMSPKKTDMKKSAQSSDMNMDSME